MNLLSLSDITKTYGSVEAVTNLSMAIRQGEIVGIIGPNGAGKSSTLGIILGLIRPDAGLVTVCGLDPQVSGRAVRDVLGYVPDEDALLPNLTALEHLEFVGLLHGVSRSAIDARSRVLIDLLDLSDFANHTTEAFSFGMRKKLQLACALIHEPQLLILDEPLNGLDAEATAVVRAILEFRRRQQRTTLLATHNLPFAERMCDRIYLLLGGQVAASGNITEILFRTGAADLETAFLRIAVSQERHDEVENLLARI